MILDTNALSAFVDGDAAVGEVLRYQARACIPVIVLGEFRYGIAQSRHRAAYEDWLQSQLRHFDVLPVTDQTAASYATLRVALRQQGTPIPANDAWIRHLADEDVAGGVDAAFGVAVEHALSLELLDRRRGGEHLHLADGDLVQAFEALSL